MPGYSNTPLYKKLGYKEGMRVYLVNAPDDYLSWIQPLPSVDFVNDPPFDIAHIFVNDIASLEELSHQLRHEIDQKGMIWISWHKQGLKNTNRDH